MPVLGEIKYGREIGYRSATSRFIWHACEICGKQRWVYFNKGNPIHKVCVRCSNRLKGQKSSQPGAKHPNWQGGRWVLPGGYIYIKFPDHPRANNSGYVMEHILVWEQVHNKPLPKGWVIHHLNGVKSDNRPENLIALPSRRHQHILAAKGKRIRELEAKVKLLEATLNSQQLLWWSEN